MIVRSDETTDFLSPSWGLRLGVFICSVSLCSCAHGFCLCTDELFLVKPLVSALKIPVYSIFGRCLCVSINQLERRWFSENVHMTVR